MKTLKAIWNAAIAKLADPIGTHAAAMQFLADEREMLTIQAELKAARKANFEVRLRLMQTRRAAD